MDQSRLLNSFFQNNSLNMLTEEISEILQCPIIVTDGTFHIVSAYSALEYKNSTYKRAIMHSELSTDACAEITKKIEEQKKNHVWIESAHNKFCVGILLSADVFMGYILYFLNPDDEAVYNTDDLTLCESLLAKQLYIERHCSDSAESTAEEILEDLLEDKYQSKELFALHISGTYLAHFSPKHLVTIDFLDHIGLENIYPKLQAILTEHYHGSHPFFYKNRMLMFLHEDHDFRLFNEISKKFKLCIVISDVLENLYAIKYHYQTMIAIAQYIIRQNKNEYVVPESSYALLIALQKLKADNTLIRPEMKAMLSYDIANGSELCLTLFTYLTCSHSLKKTAEIMYTHSNTIFYRIQKARDEFHVRIDAPELHFAYLVSLALALLSLENETLFIMKPNPA